MVFIIKNKEHTNCIGVANNLEGISKILIGYITDEILRAEADYGGNYNVYDIPLIVTESLKNFNLDNKYDSFCIKIDAGNDALFDYFLFNIEIMKYQLNIYQ